MLSIRIGNIKELIRKDLLDIALNESNDLLLHSQEFDRTNLELVKDYHNEIILLTNRLRRLESAIISNIKSDEHITIERNSIIRSFLQLLTRIEKLILNVENSKENDIDLDIVSKIPKFNDLQIQLLQILKDNQDAPLTIWELEEILGLSSTSLVLHLIKKLEEKGHLKRNSNNPQDYQILLDIELPVTYINMYGMAKCGPDGTLLSGNPIAKIPYSKMLHFPAEEAFMVKATGNSMEPRIHDGDIVIARKQNVADKGQIVICSLDSSVMIKRFVGNFSDKNNVLLESLNNKYFPIIVDEEQQFTIEGVMKGLIV